MTEWKLVTEAGMWMRQSDTLDEQVLAHSQAHTRGWVLKL